MCREFSADSNPDWQQGTNNKSIEGLTLISSPGGCRSQQGVASTHQTPTFVLFFQSQIIFMRQHMGFWRALCGVLPGLSGSGGGGPQTYFKHPCLFGKHSKSEFYIMWDLWRKKKEETLQITSSTHVLSHQPLCMCRRGVCVLCHQIQVRVLPFFLSVSFEPEGLVQPRQIKRIEEMNQANSFTMSSANFYVPSWILKGLAETLGRGEKTKNKAGTRPVTFPRRRRTHNSM